MRNPKYYETTLLHVPDDDIFCLPLRVPLFLYHLFPRDLSYHPAQRDHMIHGYNALSRGLPSSRRHRYDRRLSVREEVVADHLCRQGVLFRSSKYQDSYKKSHKKGGKIDEKMRGEICLTFSPFSLSSLHKNT